MTEQELRRLLKGVQKQNATYTTELQRLRRILNRVYVIVTEPLTGDNSWVEEIEQITKEFSK